MIPTLDSGYPGMRIDAVNKCKRVRGNNAVNKCKRVTGNNAISWSEFLKIQLVIKSFYKYELYNHIFQLKIRADDDWRGWMR